MGGAVFPPYLTWDQTMVDIMKIMVNSFRRSHAHAATLSTPNPSASYHWPMPSLETPGHSTGKSGSVSCGVTAPFSWILVHTRFCLCPPRVWCPSLLSPVLWKFYNQIPLPFKVKFPGGSQSLWWIPRLGYLLWALEISQQYKNFFGIIVHFVGCLLCGSVVCLPGLLQPEPLSPPQATANLCLCRRHSNTQKQVWLSLLWGPCVLVHTRIFLNPARVFGRHMVWF